MTDSFLANVAARIRGDHPDGCSDVLVVFNNRRAGLFLQRELKQLGDKPFFLPRIIGMDDLIKELGGLSIIPHEFLLFELFDIHRQKMSDTDSFEDFISIGEMMLNDFSEIDLYCVDAARLLGNLYDLKKLGEWDLEESTMTPMQRRYLDFYNSLHLYYANLRSRLFERGEAYNGMAYRNVAENIKSLSPRIEETTVYFVGFNALSVSESTIIKWFESEGRGLLLCDGDQYYYNDTVQEAGHFLRHNAEHHNIDTEFGSHFANGKKKIHIVNSPENMLQAKAAGSIIANAKDDTWGSGCAIVLADEKMLMPMLNSLPESIDSVNVTMGLPYTLTGIHNTVCKLLTLYSNLHDDKFYHIDIINLFSDSIISRLIGSVTTHHIISTKLNENKTIYASSDEIRGMLQQIHSAERVMFLFDCDNSVSAVLSTLRGLVQVVNESQCLSAVTREQEALACLLQMINHFEKIQVKYDYIQRLETFRHLYLRLAKRRNVALYGEPLKDIQLLGMLETRNLDFDRLIILSVNEGILPAGRNSNTLIPYTLKRAFGLPTHEEKDAVYAYNFFRLIQRAEEVWLIYSSDAEGMGKGEPSRFLMQLRDEMAPRLNNIKISTHSVDVDNHTSNEAINADAKKTERAIQRLKQMAERGFSPSALNRYRNCPLQFYLADILGVHEQEELNEEVESNELGTFVHELLCKIYSIDKDKHLQRETLATALKELPETIEHAYQTDLLKGRSSEGKNRLYIEAAKLELSRFLEKEIERLKKHTIQMILTDGLPIKQRLPISQSYVDYPVNIEGTADRVDYFDGQLRIIDYKSGGVKDEELRMNKKIDSPRDPSDKWFQVMTYAWLFCRSNNYNGFFESGIFPLRTLSSDLMKASWNGSTTLNGDHIEQFEQLLSSLVSEILNPELDFIADPKKDSCKYCSFKRICKK